MNFPRLSHMEGFVRADLWATPDTLYVFGDNLCFAGGPWHAREARGEPNAVGIVVANNPFYDRDDAKLRDDAFDVVKPMIQSAYRRLLDHLKASGTVIFPMGGIDTGRLLLHETSPRIDEYISSCQRHLIREYERIRISPP